MASLLAAFCHSGLAASARPQLVAFERAWGGQTWRDEDDTVRLGGPGCRVATSAAGACVAVGLGEAGGEDRTAEAVLAAYRRSGVGGLADLRGDYAFALWDAAERTLLVGCDALGVRAPAYTWSGGVFLLSSRALDLVHREGRSTLWNEAFIAHALSGLWAPPGRDTAFRGVTRMMGGEILRLSARGIDRLQGDRLRFGRPREVDEAVREIEGHLDRVVTATRAAGPACVELSGGLDSSVVAAALMRERPELDAFSLVAPPGAGVADPPIESLKQAFPRMRSHRIVVTPDLANRNAGPIPDDPMHAGAGVWAGRLALAQAARSGGFVCLLDGEGGDEMFDLLWWPADLVRELALGPVVSAVIDGALGRRVARDFVVSGGGPLAGRLLRRARRRMRLGRPWLRPAFWESACFEVAHGQAWAFSRLRSARERIPEVLAALWRTRRGQQRARQSFGVEGVSPLADRSLVELIGSLRARVALDLECPKSLLRRVAERRLPRSVAWRRKSEPLHDWLVKASLADDSRLARTVAFVRAAEPLSEMIDPAALVAATQAVRASSVRLPAEAALGELFVLVEWMAAVSATDGTDA